MPLYDNNGSVNTEIGKIYDNNGIANSPIGYAYDNNGTTSSLVYQDIKELFNMGNVDAIFTVSDQQYTSASVDTATGLRHYKYNANGISNTSISSTTTISMSGWKYLNIQVTLRTWPGTNGGISLSLNTTRTPNVFNGPWTERVMITDTGLFRINLASFQGSYYVVFNQGYSTVAGNSLDVRASRIWLSDS